MKYTNLPLVIQRDGEGNERYVPSWLGPTYLPFLAPIDLFAQERGLEPHWKKRLEFPVRRLRFAPRQMLQEEWMRVDGWRLIPFVLLSAYYALRALRLKVAGKVVESAMKNGWRPSPALSCKHDACAREVTRELFTRSNWNNPKIK